uniref:HTH CENPB-type domain-containing protein n=1 Tax=Leptobrachium leishanense TaxID=445787 RepID=A0A8C5WL18_9ANUR
MTSKRPRSSYDASFKLNVIKAAESSNNSATARQFDIAESTVRDWRKKKTELEMMPRTKKACRGLSSAYPKLESTLYDWIMEHRNNGYALSRTAIRLHALKLKKSSEFGVNSNFLASAGWCKRFMERHNLTLRQRTKLSQKLPKDLEEKVDSFHRYVLKLRHQHNYELGQIGNMDETPMTFDLPGNRSVHTKGEKTVLVKTTVHEKTHFTVVLTCMADGTKLKPLVIFKRKTLPKNAKFPSGVVVRAQPKGWMDEDGIRFWLDKIWCHRPGSLLRKRALLVWDMLSAHLKKSIKSAVRNACTDIAVIPGGLTSQLQPLDVCLNKPFKDRLRQMWADWMCSDALTTTKSGLPQRLDITVVCRWVKDAWESMPPEMIQKSFRKCGISNAMDGTEDDAIYEDVENSEDETDDTIDPYLDTAKSQDDIIALSEEEDSDTDFEGF